MKIERGKKELKKPKYTSKHKTIYCLFKNNQTNGCIIVNSVLGGNGSRSQFPSACHSLVCSFIYSSNFARNALERKENENIESFSMESLFLLSCLNGEGEKKSII